MLVFRGGPESSTMVYTMNDIITQILNFVISQVK